MGKMYQESNLNNHVILDDDESASVSLAATLINYLNDFLTIISISSTLSLQIVSKVVATPDLDVLEL